MKTFARWRVALAALACLMMGVAAAQPANAPAAAGAAPAQEAAQPYNNAPAYRAFRAGEAGFTQLGDPAERGVLIQSTGETWRALRVPLLLLGGLMVAAAVAALGGFYALRGTMKVHGSGQQQLMVLRFLPWDRYAHWFLAIVWVVLAVTGLILSFGKTVLLPVIGHGAYSWIAVFAKNLHNFTGPLLIIAMPLMFVRYLRYNWIGKDDIIWLTKIFAYLRGHEHPSGKFNAGEKMVFWGVLGALTTVLIVTGLVMDFPNFGQSRATMQVMTVLHMSAAYISIAIASVHMYLGTIGMGGAYRAMRHGYVTTEWAQHHHELWYQDVVAGKVPESPVVPDSTLPAPVREAIVAADR